MAAIEKPGMQFGRRRRLRSLFVRLLKCVGAVLLILITIATAENNLFGYAWRASELAIRGDDGNYGIAGRPEDIVDQAVDQTDGSLTVLAVGDIVSCPKPDGIKRDLTTIASWLGLDEPLDRSKVAAVQTVELAENWPNAPILALGDIVYHRGTPHEFTDCFHPIWGEVSERTLPTPGNHEYYTPYAYAYFDYWGQQAGPERRGYYAITHGNWLVLSLNSEVAADAGSAQGQWLSETLASASQDCILAYYHRPAHSSKVRSNSGSEHDLFEQLAKAGADIILNGHDHHYERSFPMDYNKAVVAKGGTVSFIVGTGGRSPARERDPSSNTQKALYGEQGILRLELRDGDFEWAFHSTDAETTLDEGTRACSF